MAARSVAVKAAQTVIATEVPIKADGVWGPRTDSAYVKTTPRTKLVVQETVTSLGWDVSSLRPPARIGVDLLVRKATDKGIKGKSLVNLLSVVDAESGFIPRKESHVYRDPVRAKRIFSALREMSDSEVTALVRKGPNAFFEAVYGAHTSKGRELGNMLPGDGAKFAGSGLIQLTGRDNFTRFAKASGHDVVNNPSLMSKPDVAADAAVWYWETFVAPGGRDLSLASATNAVNPGLPDQEKQQRYALATKYQTFA